MEWMDRREMIGGEKLNEEKGEKEKKKKQK